MDCEMESPERIAIKKTNVSHLSAGSIRPTNSRDGFEDELRSFATHGNDTNAAGRAAFFLKVRLFPRSIRLGRLCDSRAAKA